MRFRDHIRVGRHPSGRKIERREVKDARSIPRIPASEPLTPGLRPRDRFTSAIGFHVDAIDDYWQDEDQARRR